MREEIERADRRKARRKKPKVKYTERKKTTLDTTEAQ
jgi:hypothetical protein